MDFNLREDQLKLQETAKRFTEKEIEPIAEQIDQEGRLPDDLIIKMGRMGFLGMVIPKQYGGGETEHLNVILTCEAMAYSGTGAWWLTAFNNSIPESIAHFGSEEIKRKFLQPLCEGSAYGSIQFTEEGTGSDPTSLLTRAVPHGRFYIVNGMKRFSTFGERDGYAVLYAKDENDRCTAFVIKKNGKGYQVAERWRLMGGGGMEAVDIYFNGMEIPEENLLGEKGRGFDILLHWIATEKIEQCSACVGMAQAALDEAVKYAKLRRVKEKTMSGMQSIQWMLAEMYSRIEAARWLTYRVAFLQGQGEKNWMTESATAKLFVMPATLEVVEIARRIHGAYGYCKEFKIERIYRAISGATAIATGLEINRSIVGGWLVK